MTPSQREPWYETKPGVFSLEGFIGWLETQDPATEYDFWNCRGACLLSTYLGTRGLVRAGYARMVRATSGNYYGAKIDVSCDTPWTYGAALDRARLLSSQSR